jgi:hypothetical protein
MDDVVRVLAYLFVTSTACSSHETVGVHSSNDEWPER